MSNNLTAHAFDQWSRMSTFVRNGGSRESFFTDRIEGMLAAHLKEKLSGSPAIEYLTV